MFRRRNGVATLISIILTIGFTMARTWLRQPVNSSKAELDRIVQAERLKLPRQLDSVTTLVSIDTKEGFLILTHQLAFPEGQKLPSNIDDLVFEKGRPEVVSKVCADPITKEVLRKGVSIQYLYDDNQNRRLAQFNVTKADCP